MRLLMWDWKSSAQELHQDSVPREKKTEISSTERKKKKLPTLDRMFFVPTKRNSVLSWFNWWNDANQDLTSGRQDRRDGIGKTEFGLLAKYSWVSST